MKKALRRLAAIALLALIGVLAAVPAWATTYTPVTGTSESKLDFNQYLIVDKDARIPQATFTYTITPGEAAEPSGSSPRVFAGVGTPTVSSVTFSSGETAYDEYQTGDSGNLTITENQKYARKVVTVSFNGVSFTEPGIWRYKITANESSDNKAVTYDTQLKYGGTQKVRYIDVYVVDNNGTLEISTFILRELTTAVSSGATVGDKSSGYINTVTSHSLTFGKEVTGNQGSKDKYFQFTIAISNAQANTSYEVDLSHAQASPSSNPATTYTTMNNPSVITTGDNGVVHGVFYLRDGQYVKIKGLPEGYNYELSELAEGYSSSDGIAATNNSGGEAYTDAVKDTTGTTTNKDIKTGYTNERTGVIPTGVIIAVAPFAAGLVIFGGGAVYLTAKRSRDDE